jgi:hypothetical protein
MVPNIAHVLRRIKTDVARHLGPEMIRQFCLEAGHSWRDRRLDPVTTIHLFLLQILHGNTACNHLPHLSGKRFTGEAYCQARTRLPLLVFQRLLQAVCGALHSTLDEGKWLGHRIWLVDGSSFSMPDMPALQKAFGHPTGQAAGCSFPVAHFLALVHAGTGLVMQVVTSPLRTHDMSVAWRVHPQMARDDVLVADRGFCSFAHLALLVQAGMHAVFRAHQKQIIDFRVGRMHVPLKLSPYLRKKNIAGLPRSAWIERLGRLDQLVRYFKPENCPGWMNAKEYAALPDSIVVRELRFEIAQRGFRTRRITLVTTLLDPQRYPVSELAALYRQRWQIELNFRHLKQTMHMDVLRCKTLQGIHKELTMFAIVYNLVRVVMLEASRRQDVPANRISFIDAMRWLAHAPPGSPLPHLRVIPERPNRVEPRVRKRRPKEYPLMTKPRETLRKSLLRNALGA